MRPHALREVPAGGLLALLVLLPVPGLVLGRSAIVQHDIWISDLLHAQLPYRAFLGRWLREGVLPGWMPDIFSGVPFLAQIEAGALWPLNLLYAVADPFVALGWVTCLELLLAAFGARALARAHGARGTAASLAGLAYAWSGFLVSHARHPSMHGAAALAPWLFLALEGLLRGRRRAAPALALLVALQLASGHPQIAYFTGWALAGRVGIHLAARRGAGLRRALAWAAAMALGAGLLAVQLVPVACFVRDSLASVPPSWARAAAYPYRPADLLGMVWPPLVGSMEGYDYRGVGTFPWGNYAYVGLATLLLALVAPWLAARRRAAWGWWALAALSLLFALGPATPLYRLAWRWVPGMDLFRLPTRALFLTDLALAVLAALAADRLLERVGARRPLVGLLLLAVTLADLAHHQLPRLPLDDVRAWSGRRELAERLGERPGRFVVLGEGGVWERAFHAAQGTRRGMGPYRAAWTVPLGSAGLLQGLRSASGYARMVHWRSAAFWQPYNRDALPHELRPPDPEEPGPLDPRWRPLLDRAGVRWVLAPVPLDDPALEPAGRLVLYLHRYGGALPRAYLATGWRSARDFVTAAVTLQASPDPVPVVEGLPGRSPPPGTAPLVPLEAVDEGPDAVRVPLPARHPAGLLVLADTWDPGWRVEVDGRPAEVLVANAWQRAVRVEADAREVRWRYVPPGRRAGAGISLAALFLLAGWGWAAGRGRSPGRALGAA